MSIAFGWQPSEWQDFTITEFEIALEQAEEYVQVREYNEWERAAYTAATALTIASGGKKQYKASDLIEHPLKKRERERKKKQEPELDNDALRKIASDKGLNPKF